MPIVFFARTAMLPGGDRPARLPMSSPVTLLGRSTSVKECGVEHLDGRQRMERKTVCVLLLLLLLLRLWREEECCFVAGGDGAENFGFSARRFISLQEKLNNYPIHPSWPSHPSNTTYSITSHHKDSELVSR